MSDNPSKTTIGQKELYKIKENKNQIANGQGGEVHK